MDGEITKEQIKATLGMLKEVVPQIHQIQVDALKNKFKAPGEE
jgi:hypothetical protein